MRLEIPRDTERLGAVLIHHTQNVLELDAGPRQHASTNHEAVLQRIPYDSLYEIEKRMAVVVPMRNERLKLARGVLTGIPNHCLTLVISNSEREPVDRFALEREAFYNFARLTDKQLIVLHQQDPALAAACHAAGYPELLDPDTGRVRNGKAEGMIVATLLARLAGREFIGFVDADNYFPGAVLEYVREYAAGFHLRQSPLAMVRISWHSKPKVIEDALFFAKWGRASRTTNLWLNALLAEYTGFETDIIRTGNAGEHAMTLDLALLLRYSSGYSIEPYHFINLFESFGGVSGAPLPEEVIRRYVEIFQIESRNPHMHDSDKGEAHIADMTYAALQVIHHSPICPPKLKARLLEEMRTLEAGLIPHPQPVRYYPSLATVDLNAFTAALEGEPFMRAGVGVLPFSRE